jgi:hypothetical protein
MDYTVYQGVKRFSASSDFFIREYKGNLRFQTEKDNKVTGFNFNGMTAKKTE